ncbi:Dfg16p PWA37_003991 [Arxiozyma heterogenica]|uniref:Dfg16p n=1 Tax=Arxiozyma heterogenica TaxID=278026 RepID=UPI002F1DAD1B
MPKCIININILTYFLSYLITFIFPPIASALNIGNYNYHNNICPSIFNDQIQSNNNSNDKPLIDSSTVKISFSTPNLFNVLPPLSASPPIKPHILQLKLLHLPQGPPPGISQPEAPPDVLSLSIFYPPTTLFQTLNPNPTFDSTSFKSPPFPLPTKFHSPSLENHCRPHKRNSTKYKPDYKSNHHKHDHNFNGPNPYVHYPNCNDYITKFKPFLSDLLVQNILKAHEDMCNATILTSGFISFSNNYADITTSSNNTDYNQQFTYQKRLMLTSPSLLIQCSNDTYSDRPYHATNNNFTKFLLEVAQNYTTEYLIDDSPSMVRKDDFNKSVLVIIFSQTAFCIAAWMMYLILLLLPASNYNNRNILVHIYVLFYAIAQSVFLAKAYNGVFKWQYEQCIQDASKYEKNIVDLTGFKVCELFLNVLSNINWAYIVIFMHNVDSLKNGIDKHRSLSESSYGINSFLEKESLEILPELKNIIRNKFKKHMHDPKNRTLLYIIITSIILASINNTFFAIILWKKTRIDFRIIYKLSELLMYTLLLWRIGLFILRNFGMTITSTRAIDSLNFDNSSMVNNSINHDTTRSTNNDTFLKKYLLLENLDNKLKYFQKWVSNIWKNYFNTVPLLIYNIVIYILSYVMIIYFTSISAYRYRWKYNLVYFTKLLITVNFWGLIGVLNRRELYLNKKTILGRRINNDDDFFVEASSSPSSFSSSDSLPEQLSSGFNYYENNEITTTTNIATINTGKNSTIQQTINKNRKKKSKGNFRNAIHKYTISKPIKSLKPNFNRIKTRRIHFAKETRRKRKLNYNNNVTIALNECPSTIETSNTYIDISNTKNKHHCINITKIEDNNNSYDSEKV